MEATINISKKFTINTGNYSSVQPSTSITVNNVSIDKIVEIHKALEIITDGLIHKQIESDALTMAEIKNMGIGEYLRVIDKDMINRDVADSINKIIRINTGEDNNE